MTTISTRSASKAFGERLSARYAKNTNSTSGFISAVTNDSTGRPKTAIVQIIGGASVSVAIPYGSNIYPGISVSLVNDGSPSLASWRIANSSSASPVTVGGQIVNQNGSIITNFDSIWVKDRGYIMAGGFEDILGNPTGPRVMLNEYGLFGYAIPFPEPVVSIATIESDDLHVGDVLIGYQRPSHANFLVSPEQGLIQFSVDDAPFLTINGGTGNRLEDYLWIGPSSGPQVGMGKMLGVAEFAMRDTDNRYVFLVRSDPMRVQVGAENDTGYLTWENGNMDMSGSFSSADGRFKVDDTGVEFTDALGSYWRLKPSEDIFMRIVSEGTSNYNTFRVDENAGVAGYFKGGTIALYARSQTEGIGIMGFSSPYVEGGPPALEGGEMVDYIKSIDSDMTDGLTAVHNGVSIYGLTQGGLALRLWAPGDPPGSGGGGRALWAVNEDAAKNAVTVSNTGGGPALVVEQGGVILNENGTATSDLRVESDNYDALFIDASNDSIAIMNHVSGKMSFFAAAPTTKPTGVAVTAAGIHAALVSLGLIGA